jgi:hypothetical protein
MPLLCDLLIVFDLLSCLGNHQIENKSYEKTLLGQTNFEKTLPAALHSQAKLAVKGEYTFDFLELGDEYSERHLELAILAKVQPFLREMGGLFAFVDLLLYHRRLHCLVAVDLKIGEFLPEYVGKMQFYLVALDEQVRVEGENPAIGIILCKSKDKTIVEYALRESNKPIGVATYRMVTTLPHEYEGQLPAPEQVAKLLEGID